MPRKKRKIGFYYLTLRSSQDIEDGLIDIYDRVINFILTKNNEERNVNLSSNKFGYLASVNPFNRDFRKQLIFKSAIHSYRPPLIHSQTVAERENPKLLQEGELNKTHAISKEINGDVIIIIERSQKGLTINQVVEYLNIFVNQIDFGYSFRFDSETVADDNFEEKIREFSRVVSAEIFVDKQMLGSAALDYSNNIETVQQDIIVKIKAKKRNTIIDFARDAFAKFNGGQREIRRMRIVGRNQDNNEVKINTDFIERQEYINAIIDENTGEFNSHSILEEMEIIMQNF